MEGGGIREACSGAVGLLCTVWLSRFSLRRCRRGFQDLLSISPSSLFMLCGCISISMASLMRRSMYLVFVERSLVSCSLIVWSSLKLCSATADFNSILPCTQRISRWFTSFNFPLPAHHILHDLSTLDNIW